MNPTVSRISVFTGIALFLLVLMALNEAESDDMLPVAIVTGCGLLGMGIAGRGQG